MIKFLFIILLSQFSSKDEIQRGITITQDHLVVAVDSSGVIWSVIGIGLAIRFLGVTEGECILPSVNKDFNHKLSQWEYGRS